MVHSIACEHHTLSTGAPLKYISYNVHRATTVAASLETILPMPVRSPRLVSELKQVGSDILCQNCACAFRHPAPTQWSCQEPSQLSFGRCVRAAIVYEGKLVFWWWWTWLRFFPNQPCGECCCCALKSCGSLQSRLRGYNGTVTVEKLL